MQVLAAGGFKELLQDKTTSVVLPYLCADVNKPAVRDNLVWVIAAMMLCL